MTTVKPGMGKILCFHDGHCPLCAIEVRAMRKLDRSGRIEWVDIHSGGNELARAGISHAQAMRALHIIDTNGQTHSGVPAFLLLWETLPGYRHITALVRRSPRLLALLNRVYAAFARVRPRLGQLTGRRLNRP